MIIKTPAFLYIVTDVEHVIHPELNTSQFLLCRELAEDQGLHLINLDHLSINFGIKPSGPRLSARWAASLFSVLQATEHELLPKELTRCEGGFHLRGTQYLSQAGKLVCIGFVYSKERREWSVNLECSIKDGSSGELVFTP